MKGLMRQKMVRKKTYFCRFAATAGDTRQKNPAGTCTLLFSHQSAASKNLQSGHSNFTCPRSFTLNSTPRLLSAMNHASAGLARRRQGGVCRPPLEEPAEPLRNGLVDGHAPASPDFHRGLHREDLVPGRGPIFRPHLAQLTDELASIGPGRSRVFLADVTHAWLIPFCVTLAFRAGELALVAGHHEVAARFARPKHFGAPSNFGLSR